tara:strand:+ start:343 stop:531 length:189 start_codon:yes stop_codon:yes gene_type:complete
MSYESKGYTLPTDTRLAITGFQASANNVKGTVKRTSQPATDEGENDVIVYSSDLGGWLKPKP